MKKYIYPHLQTNHIFCSQNVWSIAQKLSSNDIGQLKFYRDIFNTNFKVLQYYTSEWPLINNQQVDLFQLFNDILNQGGFFTFFKHDDAVLNNILTSNVKKNAKINQQFNLSGQQLEQQIADVYTKYLLLFEQLLLSNKRPNKQLVMFIRQFYFQQNKADIPANIKHQQLIFDNSAIYPLKRIQKQNNKTSREIFFNQIDYSGDLLLNDQNTIQEINLDCSQFEGMVNSQQITNVINQLNNLLGQSDLNQNIDDQTKILSLFKQLNNYYYVNMCNKQIFEKNIIFTQFLFKQIQLISKHDQKHINNFQIQITVLVVQLLCEFSELFELKWSNDDIYLQQGNNQENISLTQLLGQLKYSDQQIQLKYRLLASFLAFNQFHQNYHKIKQIFKQQEQLNDEIFAIINHYLNHLLNAQINMQIDKQFAQLNFTVFNILALLKCQLHFEDLNEGINGNALDIILEIFQKIGQFNINTKQQSNKQNQNVVILIEKLFEYIRYMLFDLKNTDLFDEVNVIYEQYS